MQNCVTSKIICRQLKRRQMIGDSSKRWVDLPSLVIGSQHPCSELVRAEARTVFKDIYHLESRYHLDGDQGCVVTGAALAWIWMPVLSEYQLHELTPGVDNAVLTSETGEQYFDKTRPNKDTGYSGGLMSHS